MESDITGCAFGSKERGCDSYPTRWSVALGCAAEQAQEMDAAPVFILEFMREETSFQILLSSSHPGLFIPSADIQGRADARDWGLRHPRPCLCPPAGPPPSLGRAPGPPPEDGTGRCIPARPDPEAPAQVRKETAVA